MVGWGSDVFACVIKGISVDLRALGEFVVRCQDGNKSPFCTTAQQS